MTKIFNKSSEKAKRQYLRNNMPTAEKILWTHLKNRQIEGIKFRRQYSIDKFVLDFYCPALKLAIEVDGPTHFQNDAESYDQARQAFIEALGIHFLRFTNQQIYQNLEDVLTVIKTYIQQVNLRS